MSLMSDAHLSVSEGPGAVLWRLRETAPLVQCITNAVVVNFTANALLAVGAAPIMADVPEEAGECAAFASALLVNLGTPTAAQRDAMIEAVTAARAARTPWVLDPVGVGALALRTDFAQGLLELGPAVIRGNASEILALAAAGAGGRGVDAAHAVDDAVAAAHDLARRTGAVVAISGPVDAVCDGARTVRVTGGSALLTRVTGGGCSLGAVVAACLAAADGLVSGGQVSDGRGSDGQVSDGESAAFAGAVAAHALYAAASERAAARAEGPGSFAVGFLDALAAVEPADVARPERFTTAVPA
ncbi:hydroxyethylthiazole kinase [Microbacterium oryzae]